MMKKKIIKLGFWLGGMTVSLLLTFWALGSKQSDYRESIAEKPFVIIIPSYNNAAYCEQNLLSVLTQDYQSFRVIYIDDASQDETYDKARAVDE